MTLDGHRREGAATITGVRTSGGTSHEQPDHAGSPHEHAPRLEIPPRRGSAKGGKGLGFGFDNFFLAVFGTPSTKEPWLAQFGGHTIVRDLGNDYGKRLVKR